MAAGNPAERISSRKAKTDILCIWPYDIKVCRQRYKNACSAHKRKSLLLRIFVKNRNMGKGRDAKPHIGIFGRRNNGKSSFINALAGQDIAIVSDIPGTTTDPVRKSMEIFGIGPVILVDTAGIDDVGELGEKRISRSLSALKTVDLAILLISGNVFGQAERNLIRQFHDLDLPFVIIHNKADIQALGESLRSQISQELGLQVFEYSALHPVNTNELIGLLQKSIPESAYKHVSLLGDLLSYGDLVLMITPIDTEAPEGRLILPQVQAIRDILDNDCIAVVVKERELDALMRVLHPRPRLVITDSQVFPKTAASIPDDIALTSFSIMLARHKGDFENYLKGTPYIEHLKDGDKILILESCTHHVACDDIGRVKIPRWLNQYTGKKQHNEVVAGQSDLPDDIASFSLLIQCGGCMITRRQVINRLKPAIRAGVPVTNYGMAIAWVHGIYKRAVAPFVQLTEDDDYL